MKKLITIFTIVVNTIVFSTIGYTAKAQYDRIEFDQERRAIECLAMNIYFETRASSLADAMAVSDVVLNRVNSTKYPNDVCKVIKQGHQDANGNMKRHRCQFSWYCDGKSDVPKNKTAWEKSRKYARDFWVHSQYVGLTEGATHYHATYVKPRWAPTLDRITRIGSHIFYRMKGK